MDNDNKENRNFRPTFQFHIDTLLLIERLRELNYGENVTYSVMSEWIGRNVQKEARGILNSAIHYLAREEAIFLCIVHGVGVQRVTESERSREVPLRGRKRIRSAAMDIKRQLEYVPPDKLSREEQRERNVNMAYGGTLAEWAKEKEAKKIVEAAPDDGKLSIGLIIDLLRKKTV